MFSLHRMRSHITPFFSLLFFLGVFSPERQRDFSSVLCDQKSCRMCQTKQRYWGTFWRKHDWMKSESAFRTETSDMQNDISWSYAKPPPPHIIWLMAAEFLPTFLSASLPQTILTIVAHSWSGVPAPPTTATVSYRCDLNSPASDGREIQFLAARGRRKRGNDCVVCGEVILRTLRVALLIWILKRWNVKRTHKWPWMG